MPNRRKGKSLYFTNRKQRDRRKHNREMGQSRRLEDVGETARVLEYVDAAQNHVVSSPEFMSVAEDMMGRGEPDIDSPGESVSGSSEGANHLESAAAITGEF